jgi:hypothetical protein
MNDKIKQTEKQYAERDIRKLDKLGGHYSRHVQAMTAEGLHSKSAIAAELAFRDQKIKELRSNIFELKEEISTLRAVLCRRP